MEQAAHILRGVNRPNVDTAVQAMYALDLLRADILKIRM
jgi:hypothetical protein